MIPIKFDENTKMLVKTKSLLWFQINLNFSPYNWVFYEFIHITVCFEYLTNTFPIYNVREMTTKSGGSFGKFDKKNTKFGRKLIQSQ